MPFFPRSSTRKLRDDNGKLIYNFENSRIHTGLFTEDIIDTVIERLKEQGYKKVKKVQHKIDLPRICPSCHRKGSPRIAKWKTRYKINESSISDQARQKLISTKLVYGHSTSPETCLIGKINVSRNGVEIELKKGLPIDALSYRNRLGRYPLSNGGTLRVESLKKSVD